MKHYLSLDDVDMVFETARGPFHALDCVRIGIDQGQFVSIIGHSGCGKSTVLNLIAGLLSPTHGGVLLEDHEVAGPGPDRAVVFQNHSLLPWLSVYGNVRLAVDKVFGPTRSRETRHEWTLHNLELVNMAADRDKHPHEISGGMKQRVGIARALAMEPKVLLMDEPFGALDALTRAQLQDTVMELHHRLANTVVMITHDVDEAVLLSDRVVMMSNGPAATVGGVLTIALPRPRRRVELMNHSEYNGYRAQILRFLYERQGQPAEDAA